MIDNAHDLFVTLHQLASFTDMLEALQLDAEARNDYVLFSHLSRGYLHKIRELNTEIRTYLQAHPESSGLSAEQKSARPSA